MTLKAFFPLRYYLEKPQLFINSNHTRAESNERTKYIMYILETIKEMFMGFKLSLDMIVFLSLWD